MPAPSHPHPVAALTALIATLDAVSLVADWAPDDDDGDRQRAGLLHLVLTDYRAFRSATRR
jgi:hypothetical protein